MGPGQWLKWRKSPVAGCADALLRMFCVPASGDGCSAAGGSAA